MVYSKIKEEEEDEEPPSPPSPAPPDRSVCYRGTSLIRNRPTLAPYSRFMSRALWWSLGGWLVLMSEVPLYSLMEGDA